MKKISTSLLLVVVTLYGVAVANPSLVLADQNSNKDNQSESKSEVKNNFSWGKFVSSLRSNINANKFFKNKEDKKDKKDGNENKDHATTTPRVATTTPHVNLPKILFATSLGLKASTTDLIWVTNKPANSNIWFGTTTPVATTTTPIVSSSFLSYFHDLSLPNLATSTLYYYTISSTDASNNISLYSNSFITPAI